MELIQWIQAGLVDMAMLNYPYAADYGIELPPWPVNTTCHDFEQGRVGIWWKP